jgi:hypothetical protein
MSHQIEALDPEFVLFEDDWSSFERKEALVWTIVAFLAGFLSALLGGIAWFLVQYLVG